MGVMFSTFATYNVFNVIWRGWFIFLPSAWPPNHVEYEAGTENVTTVFARILGTICTMYMEYALHFFFFYIHSV